MAEGQRWVVVSQEGPENYKIYPFTNETAARAHASRFWCCWVLFELLETGPVERAAGGIGPTFLIHPAIRSHALERLRSSARDADARRAAAAAADARAKAACKRAAPSKPAASANRANGKPDVSNPAVWD
ncbi:hypothetical protein AB1Y20_013010 [Prymnesium parvum]|uniref:Uncharacterized protein n=1 Tax=Prymnesium parvum TaxID=97485 RepID=A0AB34ILX8_PRYPA